MVRRRVPFPATRLALRHVGPAGRDRPGCATRPHAQERGGIRGRPHCRWLPGHAAKKRVRSGLVPILPGAIGAPPAQGAGHGPRRGQRTLAPRKGPRPMAARTSTRHTIGLSSALQPRAQSHRARLETNAPPVHAQPVLSHPRRTARRGRKTIQRMDKTK